jgi:hypothetical protein
MVLGRLLGSNETTNKDKMEGRSIQVGGEPGGGPPGSSNEVGVGVAIQVLALNQR